MIDITKPIRHKDSKEEKVLLSSNFTLSRPYVIGDKRTSHTFSISTHGFNARYENVPVKYTRYCPLHKVYKQDEYKSKQDCEKVFPDAIVVKLEWEE